MITTINIPAGSDFDLGRAIRAAIAIAMSQETEASGPLRNVVSKEMRCDIADGEETYSFVFTATFSIL